ncbi:hypothetical protein OX283_009825 [Flavobacterium sp. SUN052]|uniref:hypothetical protein n=1 Tax=Flavobacterium sp. SUN052 TaxID=3002441 RepID=UPI00237E38FC|nr:hypothetical protein [Flavobacterium sp. SUN052]MEC4004954.1 hypothetical protein [Flavobacterium sp. SUN052]
MTSSFIVGDFNGDKKLDTLTEIHTSENQKHIITEIPFINDFDSTVWYYSKHDIQTSLKSSNKNINQLDLGWSFGTYCLINIGDNNNDQKDEVALVIDYCDWSLLNSCKIYSYCSNEWKELQSFEVNENAFSYGKNEVLDPTKIRDFLENRNGKWFYKDYFEYIKNDSNEKPTLMQPIKIKICY